MSANDTRRTRCDQIITENPAAMRAVPSLRCPKSTNNAGVDQKPHRPVDRRE